MLESLDRRDAGGKPPEKPTETKPAQQTTKEAPYTLEELEAFSLVDQDQLGADDGPAILKQFKGIVSELKELRAWRDQQQQVAAQQWFEETHGRVVKRLQEAYPTLYGESGKAPNKEQAALIEEAWNEHLERARNLEARGGKPDESLAFVKRSALAVHGERILSKIEEKEKRLNDLIAQHSRRTGGGSSQALPPAPGATPLEKNMARLPQLLRSMNIAGT
jgi:hypothetical protein